MDEWSNAVPVKVGGLSPRSTVVGRLNASFDLLLMLHSHPVHQIILSIFTSMHECAAEVHADLVQLVLLRRCQRHSVQTSA
jgi:hypothetical protein